jgi:tetratricopeptide (TPR) repeat protein
VRTDAQGLQLTTTSGDAAAAYDATVEGFCGFKADPVAHVKAALEADPDFALAHCLRGYAYLMMGVPAVHGKATACLARAESGVATPREHDHFLALQAWCGGDLKGAVGRWERLLIEHPTDLLALRLANGFHFNLGDAANLRDGAARVLPAWGEELAGYGYVLGMYAFGLEECGEYARAEEAGRRAVALNEADIWAVHAVAHVMEMQGRTADGIAWLEETQAGWAGCNFFAHHVWWHKALYHIAGDQTEAALALYDKRVRDDFSDIIYDIHDAASLLWRLELAGVAAGLRWDELADKAAAHIGDHNDAFTDAHFTMCLAGAGRQGAVGDMRQSMRSYAATRAVTMAAIMRKVGLAACEGLAAYRAGDHGRAVEALLPIRYQLHRIGGSHAQRDLWAQTLIEAALKGGRHTLARALTAERIARMPTNPTAWRLHARALEALGDKAGAEAARTKAQQHRGIQP